MTTPNFKTMTKEQLIALVESQSKQASDKLLVKINSAGGVFIRHASFREFSERTGKEYVAGINMGFETAKVLFNSPEMLKSIQEHVNALAKSV